MTFFFKNSSLWPAYVGKKNWTIQPKDWHSGCHISGISQAIGKIPSRRKSRRVAAKADSSWHRRSTLHDKKSLSF
jgi:hypothetical protein